MKTRQGFISNSSSSSFLLYFEKSPTPSQIKKRLLFTERAERVRLDLVRGLKSIKREKKETKILLKKFFGVLVNFLHINDFTIGHEDDLVFTIRKIFTEHYYDIKFYIAEIHFLYEKISYLKRKDPNRNDDSEIEEYLNKKDELAQFLTDKFLEKFSSGCVCEVEYSDNNSMLEEDLEHSDCLYDLADCCIRVSKH